MDVDSKKPKRERIEDLIQSLRSEIGMTTYKFRLGRLWYQSDELLERTKKHLKNYGCYESTFGDLCLKTSTVFNVGDIVYRILSGKYVYIESREITYEDNKIVIELKLDYK